MSQREKSAAANAVGGKTARACDSCVRRRARWYCAADDAFLCQSCDSSVHAANPLARRRDRVRLKTASTSLSKFSPPSDLNSAVPAWHKHKARTPRHGKASVEAVSKPPVLLVPNLETVNENFNEEEEEEEEQFIYRVPIFDPALEEFCSPPATEEEVKIETNVTQGLPVEDHNNGFNEFYRSELELAQFAASAENLLGQDLDDNSFYINGLGLLETKNDDDNKNPMKMEITDAVDSENFLMDMEMEFSRESLEFNFDCGSTREEAEELKVETMEEESGSMVGLRLDYNVVIDAWSCRGCSPWTDGERPQFNLDDWWPDFMIPDVYGGVGVGGLYQHVGNSDGGREARVLRYREKRRTRLFSKMIRYEVRKLNAEKRPRMRGRFVKQASLNAGCGGGGSGSDAFPYV